MYEFLERAFEVIVEYGILFLECIGVVIILVSAFKALVGLLKGDPRERIALEEGIATALGFLLCGEALKTIISHNWQDVGLTCAILLMRAAMSVLIHWEVTNEKKELQEETLEKTNNNRGC